MHLENENAPSSPDDGKPLVLVVDDEPVLLSLSMDVVDAAGLDAVGATNADEALRILESRTDIRIVFTDIRMPGSIDGIILARMISRRWPSVRMIVTSGGERPGLRTIPENARFFAKPYSTAQVIETLRELAA